MDDRRGGRIKPEFAEWMRSHLGYQATETDMPVRSGSREPVRFVGVRGERYGLRWYGLRLAAFAACAAGVVIRSLMTLPEGGIPVVPDVLIYFAMAAYIAALLGRRRTRQYTWVHCHGLGKPVSREDIVTLNETVSGVRASEAADWKPAQVFVVAGANGFEEEAMTLARSHGFECYRRASSTFERAW